MSVRHLDMAGIGRALASPVTRHAVSKWRERYPADSAHPFPTPDVIIGSWAVDTSTGDLAEDGEDERGVPGWQVERLVEIEAWRANLPGRTGRPRKSV